MMQTRNEIIDYIQKECIVTDENIKYLNTLSDERLREIVTQISIPPQKVVVDYGCDVSGWYVRVMDYFTGKIIEREMTDDLESAKRYAECYGSNGEYEVTNIKICQLKSFSATKSVASISYD